MVKGLIIMCSIVSIVVTIAVIAVFVILVSGKK